jgi:hypothetical protein
MLSKRQVEEEQGEFWIERARVSKPKSQGFYSKLNEHLAAMDFSRQVWALCAPAYCEESRGGRPGIDPVVYLKMLMVGFFENLPSERAIAARCEDSLSVRAFLGYGLEESTPDHSSLSVIRQQLGAEDLPGSFRDSALRAQSLRTFSGLALGDESVKKSGVGECRRLEEQRFGGEPRQGIHRNRLANEPVQAESQRECHGNPGRVSGAPCEPEHPRRRNRDRGPLHAPESFGQHHDPEHDIEQWIDEVTETGFDDAVIADRPHVGQPVDGNERGTGAQAPTHTRVGEGGMHTGQLAADAQQQHSEEAAPNEAMRRDLQCGDMLQLL